MKADDPLSFLKADGEAVTRQRLDQISHGTPRSYTIFGVRAVVWLPCSLIVILALTVVGIFEDIRWNHNLERSEEKAAIARFAKRGVMFQDLKLIPDWQCGDGDDGCRVVAARFSAFWESPDEEARNRSIAQEYGKPYPRFNVFPAEPPPSEAELIGAFPYLRSINGHFVQGNAD